MRGYLLLRRNCWVGGTSTEVSCGVDAMPCMDVHTEVPVSTRKRVSVALVVDCGGLMEENEWEGRLLGCGGEETRSNAIPDWAMVQPMRCIEHDRTTLLRFRSLCDCVDMMLISFFYDRSRSVVSCITLEL